MQLLIDDHLRFSDDLRQMLTAQVVQGERIDKLTESQKQLLEAQIDTHERLDALILTVDDLIRRLPASRDQLALYFPL